MYLREYRKRNRNIKRVTVRMDQGVHKKLEKLKVNHNYKSLSRFILNCCLAYLDKKYLLPELQCLERMSTSMNQVSSNIYSITQKLHRHLEVRSFDGELKKDDKRVLKLIVKYEKLVEIVHDMKKLVKDYTAVPPPNILGLNWQQLKNDPVKLKKLVNYLNSQITKIK